MSGPNSDIVEKISGIQQRSFNSVFQTDIYAIMTCSWDLLGQNLDDTHYNCSDCQTTLKATLSNEHIQTIARMQTRIVNVGG